MYKACARLTTYVSMQVFVCKCLHTDITLICTPSDSYVLFSVWLSVHAFSECSLQVVHV